MKIGIIGAMESEVALLKIAMENVTVTQYFDKEVFEGKLFGKDIVLVKCGIGKVNAGAITLGLIDRFSATHIINTGIAGALHPLLKIGDIVISTEVLYHDVDVTGAGYKIGQLPGIDLSFAADERLVNLALTPHTKKGIIKKGIIATGDQFISQSEKKKWIHSTFDALCVEMEGAAIGHMASSAGVPFVIIRCISDLAEEKALNTFALNLDLAVANSTEITKQIIGRL